MQPNRSSSYRIYNYSARCVAWRIHISLKIFIQIKALETNGKENTSDTQQQQQQQQRTTSKNKKIINGSCSHRCVGCVVAGCCFFFFRCTIFFCKFRKVPSYKVHVFFIFSNKKDLLQCSTVHTNNYAVEHTNRVCLVYILQPHDVMFIHWLNILTNNIMLYPRGTH